MAEPFAIGAVVDGKYEIVRVLGEGGVGVVVEARHLGLDQAVAIEILRPAMAGDGRRGGRRTVPPRGEGERPAEE